MDTKCPQRGNRSVGNVIEYMRMMLAGNTLEQIGAEYGVTHGAVRKALQAAGLPTNSRKLLAAVPEGCTPTDAAVLRAANHALAQENHELKARLRAIRAAVDGLPPNAELTGDQGP
jgi:hypothetical protein